MEVGARLARMRNRFGLSQRELARRAGITNSTISLIESNRTNPSVGALKRILDAMPVSMSEFFAEEAQDSQIFFRPEDLTEIGKGPISYRQVGNRLGGRALQILHETYEPGADTGSIMLRHSGEEGGIIISGRMEVTVGDECRVLGPGEAYYFASDRPHRFRCVGPAPCQLVSACTPPSF